VKTKRKDFRGKLKLLEDAEPGEFEAIFATLNVIDYDNEVTVPGAFTDGQEVRIASYGHNWGDLPVGRGTIREEKDTARVLGKFFLQTIGGRETYETIKALGDLQEWSYGFDVLDWEDGEFEGHDVTFLKSLDVIEVSPVMLGAGVDTRTLDIKARGAKAAIGTHSTATTDADWDGPANEARLRNDETAAYYRKMYAWIDPDGDPETKAAYKFPHHMVDGDGGIGAANVRACQSGIGILNGARGGTTIPADDIQGVYNHLARHIRDGDAEPAELAKGQDASMDARLARFDAQLARVEKLLISVGERAERNENVYGDAGEGQGKAGDSTPRTATPSVYGMLVDIELLENCWKSGGAEK